MIKMIEHMSRHVRNICLAALFLFGLPLLGQTGLGSVTGEVNDPSGAKLPHASLRLVEKSTQTTFATQANGEGIFTFPSVAVGHYTLTIKAAGFRDRQLDNIDVSAYQQVSLGKLQWKWVKVRRKRSR